MDEARLKATLEQLKALDRDQGLDLSDEIARIERKLAALNAPAEPDAGPARAPESEDWARVKLARHPKRPHALEYIERTFDDFYELHGDRLYGDDGAILAGLAHFEGRSVAVIAQQKGRDLQENQRRNYGMPHPEGYRKAQRVMRLAERFRFPVVTLVDSAGAFPGRAAEERNIGGALAESIYLMSTLRVPVVVAVIGEGNSGGAIGIGVGDRVLIMENAYYSVITPEGCAAILWRDRAHAARAAQALRITAPHLRELGIVDAIVAEPEGGAHADPERAAELLKDALRDHLTDLLEWDVEELLARRFLRYQNLGVYDELPQEEGAEVPHG